MPKIDLRARREEAAPELVPSALFFPVKIRSLNNYPVILEGDQYTHPDMKMIVRTDTNNIMGTHGAVYRLVTHERCFTAVNEAIYQSNINANGIEFNDSMTHLGARAFRYYECVQNTEVIVPNLTVALEIRVLNSYDGSLKFGYIASARKIGDTHGLTFGNSRMIAFGKHTTNISVPRIVRQLNSVIEEFRIEAESWRRWYQIPIDNHVASTIFSRMPNSNEGIQSKLSTLFRRTAMEYGFNAWSVYKTLAKWASDPAMLSHAHRENADTIRIDREKRIRACMASRQFQEMINV